MQTETWKEIQGYDGEYEVSDAGRIRRHAILATYPDKNGFPAVNIGPERQKHRVHMLVLETFRGESPHGTRRHRRINNDRTDNRLENLEWATPNVGRAGDEHGVKLTAEIAQAIRDEHELMGVAKKALARKYGVAPKTIRDVLAGRTWKS
jgi:hypothetical protein